MSTEIIIATVERMCMSTTAFYEFHQFYITAHNYIDIINSKALYRKPSRGIDIDNRAQKVYFTHMRISNKTQNDGGFYARYIRKR